MTTGAAIIIPTSDSAALAALVREAADNFLACEARAGRGRVARGRG